MREQKTGDLQVFLKRLMGLEPTTFCMAIVCDFRIIAWFCGFRLNPITGDYRGFARYWSPNGPRATVRAGVGRSHLRVPLIMNQCQDPLDRSVLDLLTDEVPVHAPAFDQLLVRSA